MKNHFFSLYVFLRYFNNCDEIEEKINGKNIFLMSLKVIGKFCVGHRTVEDPMA